MSKTIVFDFDGVIHKYRQGWKDGSIYDEPNMEVIDYMKQLTENGYSVAIVSSRDVNQIADWWNNQNFNILAVAYTEPIKFFNSINHIGVFNQKIPAMCYIDDRAILFDGNIDSLKDKVSNTLNEKYFDGLSNEDLLKELKRETAKYNELNSTLDLWLRCNENQNYTREGAILCLQVLEEQITTLNKYMNKYRKGTM